MQAKSKILALLEKDGLAITGLGNLFSFISATYSIDMEEVKKDFYKLMGEGLIYEIGKGKFITIPSRGYVKGTFIGNAKGFGFVEVPNEEDDIFIPANMCGGAIDGDKVIVKLCSRSEEGSDGQVVSVYKPVEYVTGVVEKIGKTYFVDPDNTRIPFKIKLISNSLRVEENDKVTIKVNRNKVNVSGTVIEVLGKCDDVKACELAIIRDHGLFETFPEHVLAEARKLPQEVLPSQKQGRRDLTKETIFTIDGLDAKDLDDAISIERTVEGGYKLGVHIADVGEYVKYETEVDEEAYNRGTSVYFPTSVLPMLPKELSNGICSLNEGVERLALTCEMIVDEHGNVKSHQLYESVIKSCARLNYKDVYKCLCGEESDEKTASVKEELLIMHELSQKIQAKNRANGSLDFEIPEVQFVFDENGMAVDFEKRERNDAHRLIEDFMVLANQTVAKEFCDRKIPFVYRIHESPRKEKVLSVMEYLKGLGVKTPRIPEQVTPTFYQEILKLTSDQPFTETVNKVILRSMQKAKYMNECRGHFGLALTYYCHFTSPIRRYPDLTIHRIIKEILHNGELGYQRSDELLQFTYEASEQSSLTEKNADKTEREVDDLWKAYLMKDRVGESFEGVISSVTNFGIFVELENTVEGLIKIEDLPDSGFLLLERQLKLKGQRMTFAVGDRVRVKLVASNIYTRKIDFAFESFIERRKTAQ
ncbi:MAG: ribonuclease R [Clostridia bacterium]|nr:ribonuclease R [Clostridia bacterium]